MAIACVGSCEKMTMYQPGNKHVKVERVLERDFRRADVTDLKLGSSSQRATTVITLKGRGTTSLWDNVCGLFQVFCSLFD